MNRREIGLVFVDCVYVAQDIDVWRVFCEHRNEPSRNIKAGEILYYLSDY